jgi:multidrug efflux pump subunit AcrA (membrane-fusion protein)
MPKRSSALPGLFVGLTRWAIARSGFKALAVAVLLIAGPVASAVAGAPDSAIVVDAKTGKVLFSSAADSKGAVVNMANMSTLEVEADVSESSLSKIKVGIPAEIMLDALPDARFRGRISRIVPTIDRAKATVMTKVKFDAIDPRILPEMSAKVSFLSQDVTADQQKPLTALSADAIVQRDGKSVVFVVKDAHVRAEAVTPGIKIGDLTAVTGNVKSGDRVVLKPDDKLLSGAAVKVAAK